MQKMLNKKKSGFTLIELMIVVAILGILAALAIPAFVTYVKRSKTGEVSANINSFFKSASTIYSKEMKNPAAGIATLAGGAGAMNVNCVAQQNILPNPGAPTQNKQMFDATRAGWAELGTNLSDPVYYAYSFTASAAGTPFAFTTPAGVSLSYQCGQTPGNPNLYTFTANGDLDGDGVTSAFSMIVGSDADNGLYHDSALAIVDELE